MDNCHNNVLRYISYMGGRRIMCAIVHRVSETQRYYIYHSVWESEEGEIIDITPIIDGRGVVEIYQLSKPPLWKVAKVEDGNISYL